MAGLPMRWLALATIVLLLHAMPAAQDPPRPAAPGDGIARLLLDLESAIGSGREEAFRALATPAIPPAAIDRFRTAIGHKANARAIVRERLRRALGAGYGVVVDVLVSHEAEGRVATWLLITEPDAGGISQFRIADLHELAAVEGLTRLHLDTSQQYAVKDLVINAPDLTLTMASGSAFVARSAGGITALVLRGKGTVKFSPPDPAEQLQLKIFSYRSSFETDIDTVFVRLNPAELAERVTEKSLVPTTAIPAEASRAQQVFDDYSFKTYSLDLRALTSEQWSLDPSPGGLVIEFRTSRHGWLTYTRSPFEPEDISLFDRADGHNICLYSSATRAGTRGRPFSDDERASYDVEQYAVDLAFDPARDGITGRGRLNARITASSVTTITIRLAQPLAVSVVSSPELGELLALRVIGQSSVMVGLPRVMVRGERLTLDVAYSGRLPPQMIGREAIAVQGQTQIPQPDPSLIATPEARFMYSNQQPWYPQGVASDYGTAQLRLTVPAEYQIVATGKMIGSSVTAAPSDQSRPLSGSTRTAEFVADRPVRYLSCLISKFQPVGRLVVDVPQVAPADGGNDPTGSPTSVNVEVISTPRMLNRNRQTPARAAAMLQFYARTVGEAPYPDFMLAALDDNKPGGHSPAYFVALHQPLPSAPYSWASDPVAFDATYPPFFMAHEIAHQWWGQAVGWRNYHDQWLSEGLAQYFAVLFAAEDRGPAMLQSLIGTMRNTSQPVLGLGPISLGYRIGHIRDDDRAFRSILYNKAAVVLHMLRRFIGDEAFFAGLRRFYTDWRFKKAGTDQLQAAFETATPLKLGRFFDQWVRGFTVPQIRLTWSAQDEGKTAVIRVDQAGDVFDLPLTVVLQFADGRTEERTLRIVGQGFEERLPVTAPLRRVTIRDSLSYFEQR